MGKAILGLGGAICGGCGADLPASEEIWSDENWVFCSKECAKDWPGHPPLAWCRTIPVKPVDIVKLGPKNRGAL